MKYEPKIQSAWGLQSTLRFDKQIEIFVDAFPIEPIPSNVIRIIIIQEPLSGLWVADKVRDVNNKDLYSYVFTYHQDILENNEKAVYFLCTTTWIKNYDFPAKKFGVSTLVGGKNKAGLEGYVLRHELWARQWEIGLSKDFYLSSAYRYSAVDYTNQLILPENMPDKAIMFNNQYHIAIENTSLRNAFSEKILDCFQTKTIPLHYGCPNIENYFNVDGIIIVNNVNEIINTCNSLTPDYYESRLAAIEDNYQRSMAYLSTTEILDNKLKEIIK